MTKAFKFDSVVFTHSFQSWYPWSAVTSYRTQQVSLPQWDSEPLNEHHVILRSIMLTLNIVDAVIDDFTNSLCLNLIKYMQSAFTPYGLTSYELHMISNMSLPTASIKFIDTIQKCCRPISITPTKKKHQTTIPISWSGYFDTILNMTASNQGFLLNQSCILHMNSRSFSIMALYPDITEKCPNIN